MAMRRLFVQRDLEPVYSLPVHTDDGTVHQNLYQLGKGELLCSFARKMAFEGPTLVLILETRKGDIWFEFAPEDQKLAEDVMLRNADDGIPGVTCRSAEVDVEDRGGVSCPDQK